jgi:hypothetical protein
MICIYDPSTPGEILKIQILWGSLWLWYQWLYMNVCRYIFVNIRMWTNEYGFKYLCICIYIYICYIQIYIPVG